MEKSHAKARDRVQRLRRVGREARHIDSRGARYSRRGAVYASLVCASRSADVRRPRRKNAREAAQANQDARCNSRRRAERR
jgi:hypothetical protein